MHLNVYQKISKKRSKKVKERDLKYLDFIQTLALFRASRGSTNPSCRQNTVRCKKNFLLKKKKKLTSNGAPNHYQCVVWNIKRITLEKVASKFALRVLWPVSSLANSLFLVLLPHNSPKMCTRACYSTQKGERGFYARRVKRRVVAHRSVSPLLHSGKTVFMLC